MTKDEALRLALEALYGFIPYLPLEHNKPQCDRYDQAITAIKAALEVKDEPVACADNGVVNWIADKQFMHEAELYTAPPQRTWVGLTDEEIDAIYEQHHNQYGECESANLGYERAIEAKLKEKNVPKD